MRDEDIYDAIIEELGPEWAVYDERRLDRLVYKAFADGARIRFDDYSPSGFVMSPDTVRATGGYDVVQVKVHFFTKVISVDGVHCPEESRNHWTPLASCETAHDAVEAIWTAAGYRGSLLLFEYGLWAMPPRRPVHQPVNPCLPGESTRA